eukprot:932017-Prymnesium_polylepis.1
MLAQCACWSYLHLCTQRATRVGREPDRGGAAAVPHGERCTQYDRQRTSSDRGRPTCWRAAGALSSAEESAR